MKSGFNQSVRTKLSTQTRVDPKVVLGGQILQLSGVELEQAIDSELRENPALEKLDDFEDPVTIEEILKNIAPQELKPASENRELSRSLPQEGMDLDWLDLTASVDSLWDHLLAQLRVRLEEPLWDLATYFVGSVNERGYLTCTVEDAALDCDASLEEAEAVLEALRACEPAGIGAADLRDCLTLQLRDAQTDAERLARLVLKRNWEDLVSRNKGAIAKAYTADHELVEEAFEVIVGLKPFPGEDFSRGPGSVQQERVIPVQPDIVISLEETGFLIEVPGPSPVHLRVNPTYEQQRAKLAKSRRADSAERRHVTEYVDRAHNFLDAITQRRQHLAKIGKCLVERQSGFVKTGEYRFLSALTRSQIAKELGLHESTVSRATNGKFVQIVTGDVVSFDVFFKPALRVQKMIEEILATENPGNPMSDERISQILAEKGIHVARRTVNKYRDKNKMLSSRLRGTG